MILSLPNFIKPFKQGNKETVSIDDDIVVAIKELWQAGIITLGCCSGHDLRNPSIVIHEGYDDEMIDKIKKKLYSYTDKKKFEIYQWRHELKKV